MYWADKIVEDIISSQKHQPYRVDDMFTPSGYAHMGNIRGPLIHDLIYKILREKGKKSSFTYVFNDMDPIDGLPSFLEKDFSKYMGFPLRAAPSPKPGFANFADYFTKDFQKILKSIGIEAKFLSSWEMYHQGKFDEVIRQALDNSEKIQDIYQRISGSQKKALGWLPLQVVCEKCGKLGTTRVFAWDGREVTYKCEPNLVKWAKGCGYEGKISPFGGKGKLSWKVDWPAHWKVIGVTIEGAGKDHASAGGSYDIAMELCREVFDYPQPFKFPYEHFLIGGKKMSSSKGVGLKARDLISLLPPELVRFLFCRTNYREAIEFNPIGSMAIPDLFDEYDRCAKEFWQEGSQSDLGRVFELSQIDQLLTKEIFLPRFRLVATYLQMPGLDIKAQFKQGKDGKLNAKEEKILKQRIKYAQIWLEKYAPEDFLFKVQSKLPKEARKLSSAQKEYLAEIALLMGKDWKNEKDLEDELYQTARKLNLSSSEAFKTIYLIFLGKSHGPKAAALLLAQEKKFLSKRFKEVLK
ncbi:lysine--tRNA ligase [Candidatus Woesebacteria bacterium CG_4_10_14_0_2_um_filter_39_14]|uniref:Lysine--tRNA ligase n=3 Tax=Microgenomates group TaxID=1794810 RepID=A0A2M7XM50_9BACT|nr:MAG: lysine--tRNA ligase [Candidatus Woesebacteria bacterium CG_4_10_14_0_2_um_filter_39_14]PJA49957.1 MAG: lysine--tRNA ligase [Candidatus Shapirobacteria bacterium CG_4_9_14_3_um_filter_39_13]